MSLLPIFLKLAGRRCLLVGAGNVALDKIGSLLKTGLNLRVVAPDALPEIRQMAAEGTLEWIERPFELSDLDGNFMVIAATHSPHINTAVYQGAVERNILCNSVDDIPNCDFFFGSVVSRGELQVAISTGGESPAFAQRLRREIDEQLPGDLGPWLDNLGQLRRDVLATHPRGEARRLLLHQLAERQVCESASCPSRQMAVAPLRDAEGLRSTNEDPEEDASGAKEAAEMLAISGKSEGEDPSAAKAGIDYVGVMRGLKPPPPSDVSFSAACKAQADSAGFIPGINPQPTARKSFSAACKAHADVAAIAALLKSGPDTELGYSAANNVHVDVAGFLFGREGEHFTEMSTVHLVGAGPGDPDLLTIKALRLIQTADVLLHDDLVPQTILDLASPCAEIVNVGKRCGVKSITQDEINGMMIENARANLSVVRLKGGDPLIFGRAAEEIGALVDAGIPFEIVPGITAAFAAAAAIGCSLTDRNFASNVMFSTGHHAQSHNQSPLPQLEDATRVVYMPGRNLNLLAQEWLQQGLPPDFPCAVVSHAAQPGQQVIHTTLARLGEAKPAHAPSLLIAGWAVQEVAPATHSAVDEVTISAWLPRSTPVV